MRGAYFIVLAFVIFLNFFFFHSLGPVGISLLLVGFTLLQLILSKNHLGKNLFPTTGIAVTLIFLFSYSLATRSYGFVQFLSIAGTLLTLLVWMVLVKDRIPFFQSFFQAIFSPFNALLSYLQGFFSQLEYLFKAENSIKLRRPSVLEKIRPFIIGLLVSIPILFVLIRLLSSADPIYQSEVIKVTGWIGEIFTGSFWKTLPDRIIPSLFIGAALLPFIGFYSHKKDIILPFKVRSLAISSEISVVLFLVIAVLASFLFVQWKYVFVNVPFETDLSRYGVKTYSEYVTRGFFELILIALIVYSLTWAGLLVIWGIGEEKSKLLKTLQIVLLSEFVILLFSMFRRIWLYQDYHGWSLVRIYGGIFLIGLSALTVTLFLRHFKKFPYIKMEILLLTLGLILTVFFNAEKFIIDTHPPTVNNRIDYVYLSRMSSDGYEGWKKAYNYATANLNDPEYFSAEIINRDQRRKIAYSVFILQNISVNLDLLIRNYGSDDELKNYYISLYQAYYNDPDINVIINQSPPPADQIDPNWKREWLDRKIKELEDYDMRNDIRSFSDEIIVSRYLPYNISFRSDIPRDATQIHEFDATYQNGIYSGPYNANFQNGWNRLYNFNFADFNTYQRLKAEIPLTDLLTQIRQYRNLYYKILSQPENERDYDIDISTNSPLL